MNGKENWVLTKDGLVLREGTFDEIWQECLNKYGKLTMFQFTAQGYKIRKAG